MSTVKLRHAISYHFWNWPDIYAETLKVVRETYDGPLALATDMMVWNVTDEQVVVLEAFIDENVVPTVTTAVYRRAKHEPPSVAATWISPDINAGKWEGYTSSPQGLGGRLLEGLSIFLGELPQMAKPPVHRDLRYRGALEIGRQ